MPRIIVIKNFKHNESDEPNPRSYAAGDECEVSDRCAEIATREGWARLVEEKQPVRPTEPAVPAGIQTGAGKPLVSSPPVNRSRKRKSKKSGI